MKFFHLSKTAVLATALIVGSIMPQAIQAQWNHEPAVKNIVLFHGAWADGSCWSKVIVLLEAKGFHVVAVQNPMNTAGQLRHDFVSSRTVQPKCGRGPGQPAATSPMLRCAVCTTTDPELMPITAEYIRHNLGSGPQIALKTDSCSENNS